MTLNVPEQRQGVQMLGQAVAESPVPTETYKTAGPT